MQISQTIKKKIETYKLSNKYQQLNKGCIHEYSWHRWDL